MGDMLPRLLRAAYGVYAAVAFVVVVLLVFCPLLVAAPLLRMRRSIGRLTVRSWLWSIGVPLRVRGLENLPDEPCVVICNHASYVDGIVLTAALPERFTFLVMHHVEGWPYIGLIIRRMGVQFVNREQPRAAAHAVRQLIRRTRNGESLAIFPEGTFRREPGLQPFYRGAFFIAAKAGVPVVPAVMRGSRGFFPEGEPWPSWKPLTIEVLSALANTGSSAHGILAHRDAAFAQMAWAAREGVAEETAATTSSGPRSKPRPSAAPTPARSA